MNMLNKNIYLFYIVQFASTLVFFHPIFALYLQEQLFTAFNVTLVMGVTSLATAILEIPTGFLTDRFGRKISIVACVLFDLVSIILLATASTLTEFLVYSILIAFASAFSSGTFDAFLYDTLQEHNQQKLYKKIQGRIGVITTFAIATASVIGGLLATNNLRLPIYATLVPMSVAVLASLFLTEPRYHKPTKGITFLRHSIDAIRMLFSRRQLLLLSLILILGVNFLAPIFDLRVLFYEAKGIAIVLFGVLAAVGFALYGLGSHYSDVISNKLGNKRAVIVSIASMIAFIILATYLNGIFAAIVLLIAYFTMGVHSPIESHMINLEINSHQRATVLSSMNLFKSLLLAVTIPLMGWLIDDIGIDAAFQWFAYGSVVVLVLAFFIEDRVDE
jgi:MFS family permease